MDTMKMDDNNDQPSTSLQCEPTSSRPSENARPTAMSVAFNQSNGMNDVSHQDTVKANTFFKIIGDPTFNFEPAPKENSDAAQQPASEEDINEFREIQNRFRDDDLVLRGLKVNPEQVPTKHPLLFKTKFFEGEAALENEEYPLVSETLEIRRGVEVSFDEIFDHSGEDWKYIALIGYPGSGKTTLAKRLAKSDKITLCFELNFMHLNFGKQQHTLKKLLLECSYPDLMSKPPLCSRIFQWVVKNQNKVAIIIDGLDQSKWNLNPVPPSHDYETPQKIEDLISNLCRKNYLRDVHLIITSRPHSVMTMPNDLRPKLTLLVKDLRFDDMKELFFAFAQDRAQEMWDKISLEAPHLLTLCLNPMMLQFCVQEFLRLLPSNEWTKILDTVIKNIKRLSNIKNKKIDSITKQLAVVAYDATMESTVAITIEQLKRKNLTMEQVQDLIIAVQGIDRYTDVIFEEDKNLYFFLHLLQEYFTAYHMIEELSGTQFTGVLESQFFLSQRSMIKTLVSGFLFEMQPRGCEIESKTRAFNAKFR